MLPMARFAVDNIVISGMSCSGRLFSAHLSLIDNKPLACITYIFNRADRGSPMSDVAAVKQASPKLTSIKSHFDAKASIESSHTGELVIALCGPIGSPLHKVAAAIKSRLEDEFAYEFCEIIRLSQLIEKYGTKAPEKPGFERIKALIDSGDALREKYGPSILAELAVNKIAIERSKDKEKAGSERFPPRRVCHIIDSIKNQEELDVLKLVYRDMLYFVGVYSPLPARVKALEKGGMKQSEIFSLIDRDSGEELAHGQTVRDTFPLADFFLRIDSDTDTQIKYRVERFIQLILGSKVLTPTYAETAMYAAASAAGNSACLSRQVGAAVCDGEGEVLAVGWNDVPQFEGGFTWSILETTRFQKKISVVGILTAEPALTTKKKGFYQSF
jgi:deoxycytidylate deaminase